MSSPLPPPLPRTESALGTYLAAAATTLPALFVWLFAITFLLPKLHMLWQRANLTGLNVQLLMDASDFLTHNLKFMLGGVILLFGFLELRVRAWPRYRRAVVTVARG